MDSRVKPSAGEPLGLIAGSGRLPFALARAAREAGLLVVAVGHTRETAPELEAEVHSLAWVRVGQLRRTARLLRAAGVRRAVFAGALRKASYFDGARPDLAALALLARLPMRGDDRLLCAIADWFAGEGVEIVAPGALLAGSFAAAGRLGGPAPGRRALADAAFGLRIAKLLGPADLGQTVVVREGAVVAVEAMEGTDACIDRAGALARSTVVVKAAKPGQDPRFDLPTIGPATVEAVARARGLLLAVTAGTTLVIDREAVVRSADRLRLPVVGLAE